MNQEEWWEYARKKGGKYGVRGDGSPVPILPTPQIEGGLDRYRQLSDEWQEPEAQDVRAKAPILTLKAEGGPYDGVPLQVPPKATQVLLPAAFGDGHGAGKVIYAREGDKMVYLGSPSDLDPEGHKDEKENELWLPS